jgi:hypothetical protein
MADKNDVILTSYCRVLLAFLLTMPLSLAILSYLIIYPGIYYKNPFLIFTGSYADGEYFQLLVFIGFTLLPMYLIYSAFTVPFKLVFSHEGIHWYSLWFLRPLFLRWEEITKFQATEEQSKTESGSISYYVQIVIVSKKFSTKSRSSLGPSFRIHAVGKNSDAAERILDLYQKNQATRII